MSSIGRRDFALGVGAAALLSQFFKARDARADATKTARRVLLFCTMGTNPALWTPPSATGNIFSAMTQPLSAIADDVILVDGLMSSSPGENHASPQALTGKGFADQNHVSVDQFLAKAVGANDAIPSLLLGANSTTNGGRTQFYKDGRNLAAINSPIDAFTTIFSGVMAGGAGAGNAQAAALLARKKSILDAVRGDITSMSQSLSAAEKTKLDLHLTSIRQLENRLGGGATGSTSACTKPGTPTMNGTNTLLSDVAHADLLVAAFACGLTRVGALQFGSDQAVPVDVPNLQGEAHGGFIHGGSGNGYAQLIQLEKWYAQLFVDIVKKLKATPEADGNGSLYDNTLIVWSRDMGDSVNHNQNSFPYVVSGGAGGYLKKATGGRYVHYKSASVADRHERILLNILAGMGVANFTGFGLLSGGDKTPLPELTT